MGLIAVDLGKALFHSGQLEKALEWTQRAIDLLDQAQSPDRILALHNFGVLQAARGSHDEAYTIYQKCLDAYKAAGLADKQASILEELAWYWLNRGDFSQAKACSREALDLLDTKDDGILRGRLYRVLGVIAQREANIEQAYYFLRMSYDLLRCLKANREAAQSFEALQALSHPTKILKTDSGGVT